MNPLEKLMTEFDNYLTFVFDDNMPKELQGLIVDDTIYINKHLSFERAVSTLAEEIGHYETGVSTDITDFTKRFNKKEEAKARRWSYKKILPYNDLLKFIKERNVVYRYEIAEEFELPEDVVEEVVRMYEAEGYIEDIK